MPFQALRRADGDEAITVGELIPTFTAGLGRTSRKYTSKARLLILISGLSLLFVIRFQSVTKNHGLKVFPYSFPCGGQIQVRHEEGRKQSS